MPDGFVTVTVVVDSHDQLPRKESKFAEPPPLSPPQWTRARANNEPATTETELTGRMARRITNPQDQNPSGDPKLGICPFDTSLVAGL
jgi:hypothetical protein